jgi:hypothetical protein
MERWQVAFRAAAPFLGLGGLRALEKALRDDDPRLVQGVTTSPPAHLVMLSWPVEQACLYCYCGWQGDGLGTVGEAQEFFGEAVAATDRAMGEPAGARHLISFWDEAPRGEARAALLPEVRRAVEALEKAAA